MILSQLIEERKCVIRAFRYLGGTLFLLYNINILDIILGIPMAWLVYRGWRRGLVREVTTLAGVLVGICASTHLSGWICDVVGLEGENSVLIAFFIAFVGALVLAYLLGRGVERMMKKAHIGLVNHIAGSAFGLIKALCILAVLLNNVVMLDKHEKLITPKLKEESVLYKPVWNTGNRLTAEIKLRVENGKWKEETTQAIKESNNKPNK